MPLDEPESRESEFGESRWPMAAAVVAAMVVTLLLPDDFSRAPRWLLPLIEGLLLATLIAADPGRITRRSAALRAVSVALISVLAISAIWSTIQLIDDLIHGGAETNSASALLQAGGSVWASTILAPAGSLDEDRHGRPVPRLIGHPGLVVARAVNVLT